MRKKYLLILSHPAHFYFNVVKVCFLKKQRGKETSEMFVYAENCMCFYKQAESNSYLLEGNERSTKTYI